MFLLIPILNFSAPYIPTKVPWAPTWLKSTLFPTNERFGLDHTHDEILNWLKFI